MGHSSVGLAIKTTTGVHQAIVKRMQKLEYDGLQLQQEFYSPTYHEGKQHSRRRPDFCNLLHWSQNIRTVTGKSTELGLYTSDLKDTYIIVIQGITSDGKAGTKGITFDVIADSL